MCGGGGGGGVCVVEVVVEVGGEESFGLCLRGSIEFGCLQSPEISLGSSEHSYKESITNKGSILLNHTHLAFCGSFPCPMLHEEGTAPLHSHP